jgi:hypothetical protein
VVENEVLSTATIIPDSPLGLPMDELYKPELDILRQQNKKICEIGMLASNTDLFEGGVSLMLNSKKMFLIFYLFKCVFDYALNVLKLDCMCITINPKHALTYDFLLFNDIGGLKNYDSVNGAPAIAKCLDLNNAEKECREKKKEGLYHMFFLKKTAAEKFDSRIILTPSDLDYFFVDKTQVFKKATPLQLEFIKTCYPAYSFPDENSSG